MKNDQRPGGLFSGLSYDEALKATAISLRGELLDDKTAAMQPLKTRLHNIHVMLRRVWPKDFPFSDYSDVAEMLNRATPKQTAAWHLSQMTLVLQRMLCAKSPDIEAITNLAIDITSGVTAIAANEQDKAEAARIAIIAAEETVRRFKEAEQQKREAIERQRRERRAKNNRPKWGNDEQGMYDAKILALIGDGESDRKISEIVPQWAEGNRNLNQFRIPSGFSIQKWAAILRGKKNRSKRAH